MYGLTIHKSAGEDYLDVLKEDPQGAARLEVIITELKSDQVLRNLLGSVPGRAGVYETKFFEALKKEGYDVKLLKVWNLPDPKKAGAFKYRIIYAHDDVRHLVVILGIMKRAVNYGTDYQKRIMAAYDELALGR